MRSIWGIQLDDLSWHQFREKLHVWLRNNERNIIVTPNAEMLLEARKNTVLAEDIKGADLCLVDSFAVELALVSQGQALMYGRKTGVDAVEQLLIVAGERNAVVAIVGSTNLIAGKAIARISSRYPNLDVIWIDIGMIDKNAEYSDDIARKINETKCDILIVALGHGKQERFMNVYKNLVPTVNVMIGVGGAIDIIGGLHKRAPKWMQSLGLEWVARLVQEPWRYKRILRATVIFPFMIMIDSIKQRRFHKATVNVIDYFLRRYGKDTYSS